MEPKKSSIKSKSSMNTVTEKSEKSNMKTRSNATFKRNIVKKRGVYVENKLTKTDLNDPARNTKPVKAPPRPPPGRKPFLDSILTILSKSTTGTQCPDISKQNGTKRCRTKFDRTSELSNNAIDNNAKKKSKYRSKVLNKDLDKYEDRDQIIVLQSEKTIAQTPSMNSENNSFNWSPRVSLFKPQESSNNFNDFTNSLVREVMEGKQYKKGKRVRIDDPSTLVAKVKSSSDNDTGLYNFFVDLLETTISVYNVKAEYDKVPNNVDSVTKLPLEIDGSVANKLDIETEKTECHPSSHFFCLNNNDDLIGIDDFSMGNSVDEKPKRPVHRFVNKNKRQYQVRSFPYLRKVDAKKIAAECSIHNNKPSTRRQKKKTVLNLFKEQLRMDEDEFVEPQNLYQALKVIADNKKRCQKIIHFEERTKRNQKDHGYPECVFRGPKIITGSNGRRFRRSKKDVDESIFKPEVSGKIYSKSDYLSNHAREDSNHSLRVYGYDYETPSRFRSERNGNEAYYNYHSTPSVTDDEKEFDANTFDYSESFFR